VDPVTRVVDQDAYRALGLLDGCDRRLHRLFVADLEL
jgi:hypothetical protein